MLSCSAEPTARDMLSDFCVAYGVEGIIYSPDIKEGKDGYITARMFSDIYLFYGDPPENYAVMLNSRTDVSAECGTFVSQNDAELSALEAMCYERIALLGAPESSIVIRSGATVFYSTFSNSKRVSEIWGAIIRSYT